MAKIAHPDIILSAERARTFARRLKDELLARHGLDIKLSQAQELTAAAAQVQGGWHAVARLEEPQISTLADEIAPRIAGIGARNTRDKILSALVASGQVGVRKDQVVAPHLSGNPVMARMSDPEGYAFIDIDLRRWLSQVDPVELAEMIEENETWGGRDMAWDIFSFYHHNRMDPVWTDQAEDVSELAGVLARQQIQSINLDMDGEVAEGWLKAFRPEAWNIMGHTWDGENPVEAAEQASAASLAWEPVWADLGDSRHLVDLRLDIRDWLGRIDAGELADLVADGWNTSDVAERIYLCLADLHVSERTPATDVSRLEDVVVSGACAGHPTSLRVKIDELQALAWLERWRPDAWRARQDSDPSP